MVDIWSIFDLLHPACLACGLPAKQRLCAGCTRDLPRLPACCRQCGLPLPAPVAASTVEQEQTFRANIAMRCTVCRSNPPPVTRLVAATAYAFPVDALIRQLKFSGCLPVADVLGQQLLGAVRAAYALPDFSAGKPHRHRTPAGVQADTLPQALLPVPLHPQRLRERGYNQSEYLARPLARALGIPLLNRALIRQRHTRAQSGMDLAARQQNLQQAFRVVSALPAHVAVIDDVMTSGSTLHAVAHTLASSGVQRVDAWVLARTL